MSDLSALEKMKLEKLLEMEGGYVLDFSDSRFQAFLLDAVGIDPYGDDRRARFGTSKANRTRAIWADEPNFRVGKMLEALIEYRGFKKGDTGNDSNLVAECTRIVQRLLAGVVVEGGEVLDDMLGDAAAHRLAAEVQKAIDDNNPEAGLDRLHAFTVAFMRKVCAPHGIGTPKGKALHSLFGEYKKQVGAAGIVESEMAMAILEASSTVLEAFNKVRNDHSFAHPNTVLGYDEALVVFRWVTATLAFIRALERAKETETAESSAEDSWPGF